MKMNCPHCMIEMDLNSPFEVPRIIRCKECKNYIEVEVNEYDDGPQFTLLKALKKWDAISREFIGVPAYRKMENRVV